jgi:hypothetical protein
VNRPAALRSRFTGTDGRGAARLQANGARVVKCEDRDPDAVNDGVALVDDIRQSAVFWSGMVATVGSASLNERLSQRRPTTGLGGTLPSGQRASHDRPKGVRKTLIEDVKPSRHHIHGNAGPASARGEKIGEHLVGEQRAPVRRQERKNAVCLQKMTRYRLRIQQLTLTIRSTLHTKIIIDNRDQQDDRHVELFRTFLVSCARS